MKVCHPEFKDTKARPIEIIRGEAPLLLIAPHGGRREGKLADSKGAKVNDLYTAEIALELARQLNASALINHLIDRNDLDFNRISEVCNSAPWFLELLCHSVEDLINRFGRADVLFIHGWNVLQPRVDFGVGARLSAETLGRLNPETLTADSPFIERVLYPLAKDLSGVGVLCSFGCRYPGADRDNLLQAFSTRYRGSSVPALWKLAEMADAGLINAAQLELSVPLRWPGKMRLLLIASLQRVLQDRFRASAKEQPTRRTIPSRELALRLASLPSTNRGTQHDGCESLRALRSHAEQLPYGVRYGFDFYDPKAGVGGLVNLRPSKPLWRASILLPMTGRKVAIFSSEDTCELTPSTLRVGGTAFTLAGSTVSMCFRGPALMIPDSDACSSLEHALTSARLTELALDLKFDLISAADPLTLYHILPKPGSSNTNLFGSVKGKVTVDGSVFDIGSPCRVGQGPNYGGEFRDPHERCVTLWAALSGTCKPLYLYLQKRERVRDNGLALKAQVWMGQYLDGCHLEELEITNPEDCAVRNHVRATVHTGDGLRLKVAGEIKEYLVLSHGDPARQVVYTTLGFVEFSSGGGTGLGAFWISESKHPRLTR